MDLGDCVKLYNYHLSQDIKEFLCIQRFLTHFRVDALLPLPHSTSRNCYVNPLASFRWSHDTPREKSPRRWWPPDGLSCSRPWGKLSMSFAFLNMQCMFIRQQAIIPCSVLNEDLVAMKSLALEYSAMVIPGESCKKPVDPLKQLYLLTMFWLLPDDHPSFFTHQQPMRTCFPHQWLNTHLLLHLLVRLFLFTIRLPNNFVYSTMNDWMNIYH